MDVPASPSGSRASHEDASSTASSPKASIPNARLTFRLTDGIDPEERLEEAALWKALHDEYGDGIQAVTGAVPATFGRGVRGENGPLLDYWTDPAFHARCRRRFTTVPLDRVDREVADLHRDGFGAFIKSTRSKHCILKVPIGNTFQEVAGAMAYSFIDGGPQLMVQELCEIRHEHRFFVIGRRTETYSHCHPNLTPIDYPGAQTNLTREAFWPLHEVALSMARDMREAHAVVDVAYINGAPGVVELNPMRLGQVGLFACNVRALATASRALLASVDTLPKGQDAQQGLAGTESGAVGSEASETPVISPVTSPAAGR